MLTHPKLKPKGCVTMKKRMKMVGKIMFLFED
jgi:hypothetical protein